MHVCKNGRGARWVEVGIAQQNGAEIAGPDKPRAPSPMRLVAGHGVHLQPVSDTTGRPSSEAHLRFGFTVKSSDFSSLFASDRGLTTGQEAIAVTTLLGETVRSGASETVTAIWTAYTQALVGVRRVLLADVGAAGAIRMVNMDNAESVRLILPPGARRYGDAPYEGLLPGAAVVVTQLGTPGAGDRDWGFVVSGGPTAPIARGIHHTVVALADGVGDTVTVEAFGADGVCLPVGDFGAEVAVHALAIVDAVPSTVTVDLELRDEAGYVVWRRAGVRVPARICFVPP